MTSSGTIAGVAGLPDVAPRDRVRVRAGARLTATAAGDVARPAPTASTPSIAPTTRARRGRRRSRGGDRAAASRPPSCDRRLDLCRDRGRLDEGGRVVVMADEGGVGRRCTGRARAAWASTSSPSTAHRRPRTWPTRLDAWLGDRARSAASTGCRPSTSSRRSRSWTWRLAEGHSGVRVKLLYARRSSATPSRGAGTFLVTGHPPRRSPRLRRRRRRAPMGGGVTG